MTMLSAQVDAFEEPLPADEASPQAPALFHALSEPARLRILRHLFTGEHQVRDLTAHLGLAQSTVSAHLACLRGCGLVTVRPEGRSSIYAVADPARLATLLTAAEALLDGGGDPAACSLLDGERR